MLPFLVRRLAVGVESFYTLIAGVAQEFEAGTEGQTTGFEQSKIMRFTRAGLHAKNLLAALLNHDLSFLSVAFLLAGVEPALFFSGRSMRCSLASTTNTARSKEPLCNTFLPGR